MKYKVIDKHTIGNFTLLCGGCCFNGKGFLNCHRQAYHIVSKNCWDIRNGIYIIVKAQLNPNIRCI